MNWYTPLADIESLGSKSERPGSLAGLHEARKEHLSQFFTPSSLSRFVWDTLLPVISPAIAKLRDGHHISLFDNSIGTGRLIQFADPDTYDLHGFDVHEASVEALAIAASEAGFYNEFEIASLDEIAADQYDVGLINPPFSIHLESPNMQAFGCTTFGKFGPNTSAVSHYYALEQALSACRVVAAILPFSIKQDIINNKAYSNRLAAIYTLPAGAFAEEGVNVKVMLCVFGEWPGSKTFTDVKVKSLDEIHDPEIRYNTPLNATPRAMRNIGGMVDKGPAITLPVTGNNAVRVSHAGRFLNLKFECGLVQANVLNEIYVDRINRDHDSDHRYASDMKYSGQARLDIEAYLLQENPVDSFNDFLNRIEKVGGCPVVDQGVLNFLKKRVRQYQIQKTPYSRVAFIPEGTADTQNTVTGTARETHVINPGVWGSPLIAEGTELTFQPNGSGGFVFPVNDNEYTLNADELYERFQVTSGQLLSGWQQVEDGRRLKFPDLAKSIQARVEQTGVSKILSWDYQAEDIVEICMDPKGGVIAWDMGLGKARLALALALMGGNHNLIVVEPHLVDEMLDEIAGLDLNNNQWQLITNPSQLKTLHKINIITYNRLRSLIEERGKNTTYARAMRRRIHSVIADEGHLLKNEGTQQTRALWNLSAKKRFILTGTPFANYPRDIVPINNFVFGDGTAIQPYGMRRTYLHADIINRADFTPRGIDAFRDDFVTLEWCTNEFREDLQNGAKREIPKINDPAKFRSYLGPLIKRRTKSEPMVSAHFNVPEPIIHPTTTIKWNTDHLAYYLRVADEFAHWFKRAKEEAGEKGKKINLVALLARIQATFIACNSPAQGGKHFAGFNGITSKQQYALTRLEDLTAEGHKTILYATNPRCLELLQRELTAKGIESVLMHGQQNIKKRTRMLNTRFRNGPAPVLLASLGCVQSGLNIWQANRVIFYNWDWAFKTMTQALNRTLRPQQTQEVEAEYLSLLGSIDVYQEQMVNFKADSCNVGLDWGAPSLDHEEYLHLDTILGRFCEDLEQLHGMSRADLKSIAA